MRQRAILFLALAALAAAPAASGAPSERVRWQARDATGGEGKVALEARLPKAARVVPPGIPGPYASSIVIGARRVALALTVETVADIDADPDTTLQRVGSGRWLLRRGKETVGCLAHVKKGPGLLLEAGRDGFAPLVRSPDLSRLCRSLVARWSGPVVRRAGSFERTLAVAEREVQRASLLRQTRRSDEHGPHGNASSRTVTQRSLGDRFASETTTRSPSGVRSDAIWVGADVFRRAGSEACWRLEGGYEDWDALFAEAPLSAVPPLWLSSLHQTTRAGVTRIDARGFADLGLPIRILIDLDARGRALRRVVDRHITRGRWSRETTTWEYDVNVVPAGAPTPVCVANA